MVLLLLCVGLSFFLARLGSCYASEAPWWLAVAQFWVIVSVVLTGMGGIFMAVAAGIIQWDPPNA
jgi:hypothetical protein